MSDYTITKTYFLTAKFGYWDEGKTVYHTVPCIVESDEDGERKGLFVWLMQPEHEHLLTSNRQFQDRLYDTLCAAVFGVSLDTFWEAGGRVIKAPSGSIWSQHVFPNKAYTLT